jgi:hypothetical protein
MFNMHRLLAAGAFAAALLASSACAAQSGYYRYPTANPRVADERAYQVGYDQGRSRGENDGRRNRSFDYARYDEYRSADRGLGRYGDRNAYRSLFRQGFIAGYNDGYRRYARSGSGYPTPGYPSPSYPSPSYPSPNDGGRYGSPATQNGYRDGYAQGRNDARDGDRFDAIRSARYRSGDHDYNNRYGPREAYKRDYRAAFQQGYSQGYREYRR